MRQFTLATLIDATGVDRRTLQYWVEVGALVPAPETDRAGRGVHRVFPEDEFFVACVLRDVSQFDLPTGRLIRIAQVSRNARLPSPFFLMVRPDGEVAMSIHPPSDYFWQSEDAAAVVVKVHIGRRLLGRQAAA